MADGFDYFELDGAYFRRAKHCRHRSVDDVLNLRTGNWVPYAGKDGMKPAVFGSHITEAEVMRLAQCTLQALARGIAPK